MTVNTTDPLAQVLMAKIGQRGQTGQSAMAQRLMASAAEPVQPTYSPAATLAAALSRGLLGATGAWQAHRAEEAENTRQKELFNQLTKHDLNQRDEAASFFGGGTPAAPAPDAAPADGPPPGNPAPRPPPVNNVTPAAAPADLAPLIRQVSQETGVPEEILTAQVRQESNFNPNAVGRAGEIGLAQIMPSTARQPGFGMQGVDPETLRDPLNNLRFGAQYLRARAGQGDWNDPAFRSAALARYNGGGDPNYAQNVMRWVPGGGSDPNVVPVQTQMPAAPPPRAQQGPQLDPQRIMDGLRHPNPRVREQAQSMLQIYQLQQRQERPGQTVTTADGVFMVYPDGRRERLGDRPETAPMSNLAQKQALARAEAGRPNVSVTADRSFNDRLAERGANRMDEMRGQATAAVENIRSGDRIMLLLDSGAITGTGAEWRVALERAARTAGLTDGQRVANTEQLMSELARGTLEASGQLSGPTSDRDIMFLREVASGRISLTEETIRRAAGLLITRGERALNSYNDLAGVLTGDDRIPQTLRQMYQPIQRPETHRTPPGTGNGGGQVIEYDEQGRRIAR